MATSTKRQAKKVIKGVTADQYNAALATYATKDAELTKLNAKIDAEITKIRDKYDEEVANLGAEREEAFDIVQKYCEEQQGELFSKKRSIETLFGVVGFRTGTPKLKLGKGFNWAKVLDNMKNYLPAYVRVTEEPAKDRLLIDRDTPAVKENLTKCGLIVDQDERFFIDLKKEATA